MSYRTFFMQSALVLLLAFLCTPTLLADEVGEAEALRQAQLFLSGSVPQAGGQRRAQGIRPSLTLQERVNGLYVFNIEDDGGFVIVSDDDRTRPILGFSESGSFRSDEMPTNMRAWLQGYADEIAWLKENGGAATSKTSGRQRVGGHSTTAIQPLVTSKWNQSSPYNNLCPTYGGYYSSSRSATGCVATAMAQVMYYHRWPEKSTAIIPAYTTYSYQLSLASLPIVTFDWTNMKDSYSGSTTSAQKTAVATLMKYCGYSVQMDYGPESGHGPRQLFRLQRRHHALRLAQFLQLCQVERPHLPRAV